MDDRYLWDKTGPVDADVERLERELGRFRHERRPLPLTRRRRILPRAMFAAAAALLAAAGLAWVVRAGASPRWRVESLQGTAVAGAAPVHAPRALPAGQGVETDGVSRAKLKMGRVAEISVGPNSRLRLLPSRAAEQRLALDRGTIGAKIWAPPRFFIIQTSSALAVDLGCAYTLAVDDAGIGLLRVETGWVSFERDARESIVPAGAACATRPGKGPGTPYYEDAAPEFREALERLDLGTGGEAALATVLSSARKRDGLTLWHLLARTAGGNRERVCERLEQLVPPPAGVTREAVLRGDARGLERWRWELEGMPLVPREGTFGSYWRKLWFRLAGLR
jgi:hypothetical protein